MSLDGVVQLLGDTRPACLSVTSFAGDNLLTVTSVCCHRRTKVALFEEGLVLLKRLPVEEYKMAINNLKNLHIPSSLWYKILEENISSPTFSTENKEPIMSEQTNETNNGTKKDEPEFLAKFWHDHGNKMKIIAAICIGTALGIGAKMAVVRLKENFPVGSEEVS